MKIEVQRHSVRKCNLIESKYDNIKEKNTKNVAKKLLASRPKNLPKKPE